MCATPCETCFASRFLRGRAFFGATAISSPFLRYFLTDLKVRCYIVRCYIVRCYVGHPSICRCRDPCSSSCRQPSFSVPYGCGRLSWFVDRVPAGRVGDAVLGSSRFPWGPFLPLKSRG